MEDSGSSFSLSNLLCQENEGCLDGEVYEDVFLNLNNYPYSETEEEYIEMLVERENSFGSKCHESTNDYSMMNESWLKCARLDAIQWIFKTRAYFGFRFQTAYLSVTYFDQFLSRRTIDRGKSWAIQLLSVACLSLAAKLEECKVPALSEFRVEECNFESKIIQRMELLVLNTLEWRMGSITPFAYFHYFINKFCEEYRPKHLVSRAVELVLAIIKEMNLMDHRPSAIAAAAVLAAMDQRLTRKTIEFKMSSVSSCGSLENEHVFSCYNLMQDLEMGKLRIPRLVISLDISSIYTTSTDVVEDSSFLCFSFNLLLLFFQSDLLI
uniref:Cyclin-D5-1-like n=1 Tax=Nelumbo nucifera TaxID=4432 RepID=A0A822XMR2_NELNU|nr:TPA_asm: hypothetical protein HUJ06_022795 [Nelumbo nucifera]